MTQIIERPPSFGDDCTRAADLHPGADRHESDHGAGDQPRAARRDGRRRPCPGVRRGRGEARRRVPSHRGPFRNLRRRKVFRHAAGRVGHHRHRHRVGHPGLRPGSRDPVRRVLLPGVRPDGQPPGEVPDAHPRRRGHAGHRADTVVRRNRCGRTPFGVHRNLLGAHRRPESGGAVDSLGCVLAAAAFDRQPGSGHLPGAQAAVLVARGRRHQRARIADRPRGDTAHRRRRHRAHVRRAGPDGAGRRGFGGRPVRLESGSGRPAFAQPARLRHRRGVGAQDRASRGSARRCPHARVRCRVGRPHPGGAVLRPGVAGVARHRF